MLHGRKEPSTRTRSAARVLVIAIGLALALSPSISADSADQAKGSVGCFLRSIVGEWVGTCHQVTDSDPADDKLFHAVVTESNAGSFVAKFEYYRADTPSSSPVRAGASSIATTVAADGTATTKISGAGTIYVDGKLKDQKYDLQEVLTCSCGGSLEGTGSGDISVNGMPLGLGKKGKISEEKTTWSLADGTLTVHQSIKANFKVLFFSKSYNVVADYTAKRGSDIASVMPKPGQTVSTPACAGAGGK